MKFTFKKEPRETGLRAVGHPHRSVTIKLKKKKVGMIHAPYWASEEYKWKIMLMVEDPEGENRKWHWITLKARFDKEQEARDFLNEHIEEIMEKYDLHSMDPQE